MTDPAEYPAYDSLWNYEDPAGTEVRLRDLLPTLTPGGAEHVELLTQIARAQGLQRQFEAAHATLDQAEALLANGLARPRLRCLLERGRVFNSAGRRPEASARFREALDLATAAGEDFFAVDAAHMLALSEPPADSVVWNRRAIDLAERSSQPRARQWLGSLYNNLGWALHDQGDYPQALDLFERALRFREAHGQPADVLVARWCVARCWRSLGRLEEALAEQRALAAAHAAAGTSDGYVEEELGECLLRLGQPAEARAHFEQAHAILSQDAWLAAGEPERLARLKRLAEAPA